VIFFVVLVFVLTDYLAKNITDTPLQKVAPQFRIKSQNEKNLIKINVTCRLQRRKRKSNVKRVKISFGEGSDKHVVIQIYMNMNHLRLNLFTACEAEKQ